MAGRKAKKERSVVGRVVGRILLWLLVLLIIAGMVAGIWFYNRYGRGLLELKTKAEMLAINSKRDDFSSAQTSICYYSDGSVMQVLKGAKNVYYLPYNSIPTDAVSAVLAVEDRKFFSHKGYDVYAIARAARAYIENDGAIRQGGSTITQQLARNIYLTNEKTVERKVTEIFLAAALERKYSKYDILEFYLNNIYFANGYYGLQAAAKGYFGVTAGDLTLSQTAFLCGIPNSPVAYDPLVNFDNTMKRRDSVLKQMRENGFIGEEPYQAALAEEIKLVCATTEKNNYEETFAYRCAVQALMEADGFTVRYYFNNDEDKAMYDEMYEEEYARAWRNLYTKGYRIYTSINPIKQDQLQNAVDEELSEFDDVNDSGIYKLQASAVCIDNDTGMVVAIVGGRYQESVGYTLNRAFQSPRQLGSSLKPLLIYTPAFERGYYPDTTVVDEYFEDGPRNSGDVYSGEIDVRYAVSVSKNTVAWKLFTELGIGKCLEYLKRMNFAHIVDTDYYPAASLGGLTYGATAVEMTSGFATLANDGVYRTPTCIVRITDTMGNPIVDNQLYRASTRIYDRNAARMMTDVLTTVMETGTGRKLAIDGQITAGKTGTATNQKDGWFLGYTRYYTTGVWVGYDMPQVMEDLKGNTYPAYIWHHFMEEIHEGLEAKAFEHYVDNRPPAAETDEDDELDDDPMESDVDNGEADGEQNIVDLDAIEDLPEDLPGEWPEDSFPYGWIDTDNDGIPDSYPYGWIDNDGDGIPDGYPPDMQDSNGDGIPDIYEYEEPVWVNPRG